MGQLRVLESSTRLDGFHREYLGHRTTSAVTAHAQSDVQEFLLFLLPLINLRKLKVRLYRFVSKLAKMPQYVRDTFSRQAADSSSPKRDDDSNQDPEEPLGALHYLPSNICAICYSRVAMPTNLGIADAADPTDPTKLLIQQASSMPTALGSGGETVVGTAAEEHEAHIPYLTNCCGAEYCYYCIVGELVQWEESSAGLDGPWQCLRCGKGVTDVKKSMQ